MRTRSWILMAFAALAVTAACQKPEPKPEPAKAAFLTTLTLRDVMKSMVAPNADALWASVQITATEKGVETKAPKNQEEWDKVRAQAVTILEASNSILIPGRKVAKPGEQAKDPKIELSFEEIETLINMDPKTWAEFAHGLHDATMKSLDAIDKKNPEALSDAGNDLDMACEKCHKKYWYPNEGKGKEEAPK